MFRYKDANLILSVLLGLASPAPGDEPTAPRDSQKLFRAGAATVDIAPTRLPVLVNGGFLEQRAEVVRDPLQARGLVLDDDRTRLAIVVVDSCMLPRELVDRAKALAHERTGLAVDRMLVSATHTHSAPSAMGALGSRPDTDYVAELPGRIAEAIARASANLEPAEVGWAVGDDFEHTHCRNWIRRPDRILADPFGDRTVRANMHPGYENPDVIGPSGPVDPALSVLAVRSRGGRPLAVLANYAMHYFGAAPVSADYYGRFATQLSRLIAGDASQSGAPFVAMMSQGTSGDQHWMDYARPRTAITIDAYAEAVAAKAHEVYRGIAFQPWVPLAITETRLTLGRRLPDEHRLAWARKIVAAMGDRVPRNQQEVYAREALYLHDEPTRELKLQAIRIGELGIAAIPNEVFGLTGLKIKAQSPLVPTFIIELANGSEGYIPPPELHALGGYNTWPARTAGLEVQAEPRIVAAVLGLLEEVSGRPRRLPQETKGAYAESVLRSRPLAYWRLSEMRGTQAADASGHDRPATFEGPMAFYLEGPSAPGFATGKAINRAVHLAGGHIRTTLPGQAAAWSVELWFWNGLPSNARAITGTLVARGGTEGPDERLVISGTRGVPGRLTFSGGDDSSAPLSGQTEILPRTWHHLALVRAADTVAVYLDGRLEIEGRVAPHPAGPDHLRIGGDNQPNASLEGKLDEVAVYDRSLRDGEIQEHFQAASIEH
jgi:hypothetical protein